MKTFRVIIGFIFLSAFFPAYSQEGEEIKGRFYISTKSQVVFFLNGETLNFRKGKSTSCTVKAGDIVTVLYRSKFAYNGLSLAFLSRDKTKWVPFHKSKVRVLKNTYNPQFITSGIIRASDRKPKKGSPEKKLTDKWSSYKLPPKVTPSWIGPNKKMSGPSSDSRSLRNSSETLNKSGRQHRLRSPDQTRHPPTLSPVKKTTNAVS